MTTDNASTSDEQQPDIAMSGRYRFPLPPHPVAAEQARILVRLALAQWSISDISDDARSPLPSWSPTPSSSKTSST